jgi:UDP-2-acetamido-2,6-beta-L-arabino-hexul-4-ose reductase
MRAIVEEITIHQDQRGVIFEPLSPDALAAQHNVHVVLTEPGGIRGNHQHRLGTEIVTVYGPALVRLRDGEEIEERIVAEGCVVRFTIPTGVSHAFKNIGERSNLLICFNTEVHDQSNPDVVPDVLIKD